MTKVIGRVAINGSSDGSRGRAKGALALPLIGPATAILICALTVFKLKSVITFLSFRCKLLKMQHLVRRANIRIFQFPEIFHPKIANFVIVSTLLFIFFCVSTLFCDFYLGKRTNQSSVLYNRYLE